MLVSDYAPPRYSRRKHRLNEAFFGELTPESVYWLGYVIADGCVTLRVKKTHRRPQFIFSVASKDAEQLRALRESLGASHALSGPHKGVYQLIIDSYLLCLSLERLGVLPRKSLTARLPEVPEDLRPHLLRGVFDGDGSFNEYYRPPRAKKRNGLGRPVSAGRYVLTLSQVGSAKVCQAFHGQFGGAAPRRKSSIWTYQTSGRRAATALRYMYEVAGPALARKQALFGRLLGKEATRVAV